MSEPINPGSNTLGLGIVRGDGTEVVLDTPEKLMDMIKNSPQDTFDMVVLLASRLYEATEMNEALNERLVMLGTTKAEETRTH